MSRLVCPYGGCKETFDTLKDRHWHRATEHDDLHSQNLYGEVSC